MLPWLSWSDPNGRCVRRAVLNYAVDTGDKRRFHANDHSLDTIVLEPHEVEIVDARSLGEPPTLDGQGAALLDMPTSVADFRDADTVASVYTSEVREFIQALTGADEVVVTGPATLRFSDKSHEAGTRNNSYVARFIHSDCSHSAAAEFNRQNNPRPGQRIRRAVQHNIWRAFSPPPQDMPLAVCDARSVSADDIVIAEAAFDRDGEVEWSFDAMLFRYNPAHRWLWFPDMTGDDVVVFKRHDTDPEAPCFTPHTAFTDPNVPNDAGPRTSVEMRTIAYWFD